MHRVAPGSGHSLVSGPQLRLAGSGSSCLVHLHHPKAAKSPKGAPGQATYRRPSRSPETQQRVHSVQQGASRPFHGLDENSKVPNSVVNHLIIVACRLPLQLLQLQAEPVRALRVRAFLKDPTDPLPRWTLVPTIFAASQRYPAALQQLGGCQLTATCHSICDHRRQHSIIHNDDHCDLQPVALALAIPTVTTVARGDCDSSTKGANSVKGPKGKGASTARTRLYCPHSSAACCLLTTAPHTNNTRPKQ